jgi:hypothetical protein
MLMQKKITLGSIATTKRKRRGAINAPKGPIGRLTKPLFGLILLIPDLCVQLTFAPIAGGGYEP